MDPNQTIKKTICIADHPMLLEGDTQYLGAMPYQFEPDTIAWFQLFCEPKFQVLDIGANIGCTALALARICPSGQVVAIEPCTTYFCLS